jgi:hypothetical protein
MAVLTMAFRRQRGATHGNGFACFSRSHGRPFCHRLPPVATARLHKRSNPRGADASYERLAETHRRRGGDPRVRGREQQ